MKTKSLVILGSLFVAGVVIAGILYVVFPVAMTTYGGMGLNYLKSLNAPAGTLSAETNPAYKAPVAVASGIASDRPRLAGRGRWRLAELQQDALVAAVLAARPDQHQECRQPEGLVHVRPPHGHGLRIRFDHGE